MRRIEGCELAEIYMKNFEETGVILPAEERIEMPSLTYAYGTAYVTASYCGFSDLPYPPRGTWQHGWVRRQFTLHPALAIWDDGRADKNE